MHQTFGRTDPIWGFPLGLHSMAIGDHKRIGLNNFVLDYIPRAWSPVRIPHYAGGCVLQDIVTAFKILTDQIKVVKSSIEIMTTHIDYKSPMQRG